MKGLVVALAVLASPALALDCADPADQMEMTACAERDWQAEDAALNAEYKRAMARAREYDSGAYAGYVGAAAALKTAQRAWIAFRDGHCAVESFGWKGGTAEAMVVYGCLAQVTRDRTEQLAGFLLE